MRQASLKPQSELQDWANYWLARFAVLPAFDALATASARTAPERWVDVDHEKGWVTFYS